MNLRTDYSDVHFKDNGKLKLLIIVGTRPEIIRLAAVINKTRQYFDFWAKMAEGSFNVTKAFLESL